MKILAICFITCLVSISGYAGDTVDENATGAIGGYLGVPGDSVTTTEDRIKPVTKDTDVKQSKLSGTLTVILKDVTLLELSVKENLLYMLFPNEKIEWELSTEDYLFVTINRR